MRNNEILIFIFLIGFLFFNWPLLQIVGKEAIAYLFISWIIFIIIIAVATIKRRKE